MNALTSEPAPDWEHIHPILDEALDRLDHADRDALLLRFFEQRSLAEVGCALGANEDAARKRVTRALEKLRVSLTRRGVTTTGTALSAVLATNTVQTAPVGLAATLVSASLASATTGTGTAFTVLEFMTMSKIKAGIVGTIVVASLVTSLVVQHQTQVKLREKNGALRQQVGQFTALALENERLSNLVARATRPQAPPTDQQSELLRLRAEVTRLRSDFQELARLKRSEIQKENEPAQVASKLWLAKVDILTPILA